MKTHNNSVGSALSRGLEAPFALNFKISMGLATISDKSRVGREIWAITLTVQKPHLSGAAPGISKRCRQRGSILPWFPNICVPSAFSMRAYVGLSSTAYPLLSIDPAKRRDVYLLMALCVRLTSAALLFLTAAAAPGQQTNSKPDSAPIVQPGAPGQNSKILSAATAGTPPRAPSEADISFMQGMIMHHSQAVEMTELLRTRSHNKDVQALGKRISISQTDEMRYMKQWLEDRGKPTSMEHGSMDHMAGMKDGDMKNMDMSSTSTSSMPMMPGMLTPAQMQALTKASGPAFDHLFLTGMIQHHTGALVMVQDLFDTPGAGQDAVLFDFATDVDNTQRAEINIMQNMLKEKQ
jgi:uncharacterized protein (DUF305 family)